MTVRTLECVRCGEGAVFDTWPDGDDEGDEVLDALIRSEEWTFKGGDEYCPDCSERSDG